MLIGPGGAGRGTVAGKVIERDLNLWLSRWDQAVGEVAVIVERPRASRM